MGHTWARRAIVFSQVFLLLLGLLFLFPLLFFSLLISIPILIWLIGLYRWGMRGWLNTKREGVPHLLNVLQVDAIVGLVVVSILGLVVLVIALMVRVDVALVLGNGAHRSDGLFAIEQGELAHVQPSCFGFFFFLGIIPGSLWGGRLPHRLLHEFIWD